MWKGSGESTLLEGGALACTQRYNIVAVLLGDGKRSKRLLLGDMKCK